MSSMRIALVAMVLMAGAGCMTTKTGKPYGDPARFEKDIQAFETQDKTNLPPAGAIVCTGSSSMRGWHGTIRKDLAPLTVIPRGFGGSNFHDLRHYVSRVVVPYQPRAVVIYEGDNDVAGHIAPGDIFAEFKSLVKELHKALPEARLYILSIKPSPSRWALWPAMKTVNEEMAAYCKKDPLLTYVDVATPMLGADGQPVADLYLGDKLHMTAKGYQLWTSVLKPILEQKELAAEKTAAPADPSHH